jgi:hypothetical protein
MNEQPFASSNYTSLMDPASPSGGAQEVAREHVDQMHERCIAIFQAPDSIMDVNVGKVMKEYISTGGQPEVWLIFSLFQIITREDDDGDDAQKKLNPSH